GLLQFVVDIGLIEHGLGVPVDVVVNDEFNTGQTDAMIGYLREIEGQLRIAHVHHDLQSDLGHFAPADLFDFGLDQAVVNAAFVALGARYSDFTAVAQHVGGIGATDHGWNAQLAREDGGVAGTAAASGDDGRGRLHDRLPVGIGHVGNQDVAGLDLVHLGDIGHDTDLARADFLTDGAARDQDLARCFQAVALLDIVMP